MKKPLPPELSGRDIILISARPDYPFWFDRAQCGNMTVITLTTFMAGHMALLIHN